MPSKDPMIEDILAIVAEQFPDGKGSLNSESDLYELGLDSTGRPIHVKVDKETGEVIEDGIEADVEPAVSVKETAAA